MSENPWDEARRRRRDPFFGGSFFPPEIEREFERMRETMNRSLAEALRGVSTAMGSEPGQPFVYGFSMRVGPDGRPDIRHFGNTPQAAPRAEGVPVGAREPLVDVMAGDKEVTVTVELPGVEKENINLHVAEEVVTLRVDAPRRYYKEIALPDRVVPKTAKATCKNGILDLTVERERKDRPEGFRVDVE